MRPITIAITLPPLSTEQAIALCDVLQAVIDAVWETHGQSMAEVFARDTPLEPDPHVWLVPCASEDDVPF